jgi:hypothetical protein
MLIIWIGGLLSRILFENDDLKLVESENHYFLVSDNMRVVFNGECKIDRVMVKKWRR